MAGYTAVNIHEGIGKYNKTATLNGTSGTLSTEIDLASANLVGLILSATFQGTAITFSVATGPGGTYVPLEDGAGNAISITTTTTTAQAYGIPTAVQDILRGFRYIKLKSNATESNETITLATRVVA